MLTPLGVKCVSPLKAHGTPNGVPCVSAAAYYKHGTPNGVLASELPHTINIELLTEFLRLSCRIL